MCSAHFLSALRDSLGYLPCLSAFALAQPDVVEWTDVLSDRADKVYESMNKAAKAVRSRHAKKVGGGGGGSKVEGKEEGLQG